MKAAIASAEIIRKDEVWITPALEPSPMKPNQQPDQEPSYTPKIPKKLEFPYAGPANNLDQGALQLFGYPAALADLAPVTPRSSKLYLVPTPVTFEGEDLEPDIQPKPSPLSDLPNIEQWVSRYVVSLIEVWSGKRAAMQLARWSHQKVYEHVIATIRMRAALPKIRNIYISQPIEGVAETTVTLRYDDRVRSLVLRFEGVDKRWLCTQLALI